MSGLHVRSAWYKRAVRPEVRKIDVGGRLVDAEIYAPPLTVPDRGPWPAVLLLHEIFGLSASVRADARSLARAGYLVMAPDLYTGGAARYCVRAMFTRDALLNRAGSSVVSEIHRCLDALVTWPTCNGRLGMIGMCLTGGFVLHMARRDDMAAPVVFHHSLGVRGSGIADEDAAGIQHTIQGHFAEEDHRLCPRARVQALQAQLGERLQAHWYAGVGHGLRSNFRHTRAGQQAWQRTLAFFDEHLRAAPAAPDG